MLFFYVSTIPPMDKNMDEILNEASRLGYHDINSKDFLELIRCNFAAYFNPRTERYRIKIAQLKESTKDLQNIIANIQKKIQNGHWFINIFRKLRQYFINRRIRSINKTRAGEEANLECIDIRIDKFAKLLQSRFKHELAVAQAMKKLNDK